MDFQVDRGDLHRCRVVDAPAAPLEPGQARLRIDAFALTSNNITYAVVGDLLGYWAAFPAEPPWGRVPVWGHADVAESQHDEVVVGTRVYGFLPMSTDLVVTPGRVDAGGFTDTAPHRSALAGAYNRYLRVDDGAPSGPGVVSSASEDQRMVLHPLFVTSYLIDDFLADNAFFGADTVVISSASSKTALGTAFCAGQRDDVRLVGLTSSDNRGFVEGLGVYDHVLAYDEVATSPGSSAVYVDIAGAGPLRHDVHRRYGERLRYSMVVGATHWQEVDGSGEPLPGPAAEFFFAPTQIAKRSREWGQRGLDERMEAAWRDFAAWVEGWVEFEHAAGAAAVEHTYRRLLDNVADPRVGTILSLHG